MTKPEPHAETTGSWFNWWPSPVITSGAVLSAAVLGLIGFLCLVAGLILVGSGAIDVGILCWTAAILCGWVGFRVLRAVR